ncbi:hypothetical protein OBBRIDRAFT_804843 [Obba rivulosa]|uniref:ABC transmembrane type-1 domain-containing protein n=1 Tax=Obba rivulosa TaxID=1052685 RepID=A0A8E2DKX0_9APHY|nr:hypothetical protein OBBRIDRAFT_804843 [Obba rivulosa]
MATFARCRSSEGWGPVSPIRDLTPCFEEGPLLSSLLIVTILVAGTVCWELNDVKKRHRSRKSLWILRAKMACLSLACATGCANLVFVLVTKRPVAFVPCYVLEVVALFITPFLTWLDHYLDVGSDDKGSLVPQDEAANLGRKLQWALSRHSSLWKAPLLAYRGPCAFAAFLKFIQDCLAFLQPQLLCWLLAYISEYQSARYSGGATPSPLKALQLPSSCSSRPASRQLSCYFQHCFETGMRVRAELVTVIYQKALVFSSDGRESASSDIVNLMLVNPTRLQDLCTYSLISISGPFQIFLAFISLYDILGWPAFVGVAVMIVSIPLNTVIARMLKNMQEAQMKNRDKRTRLMSDLLANIRSIKLYAWENAFMRWILQVRSEQELKMLRKIGIVTSLNTVLWCGIPPCWPSEAETIQFETGIGERECEVTRLEWENMCEGCSTGMYAAGPRCASSVYALHTLLRILGVGRIRDTQCGFKLFSWKVARALFPAQHLPAWAFDVELLLLVRSTDIPVAEVPVAWHEVGGQQAQCCTGLRGHVPRFASAEGELRTRQLRVWRGTRTRIMYR